MFPIPTILQYGNTVVPSDTSIKRLSTDATGKSVVLQYGNGELYALGQNSYGCYGTGDSTTITGAWKLIHRDVRLYCAAGTFSIIITTDNKVYGSGKLSDVFYYTFGYNFGSPTVYTDITSAFSQFDISAIKYMNASSDSYNRLFIVDGNDTLYGIGSNQSYSLGAGSATGYVNWTALANGTNVKKVQPCLYGTWILKTDGTVWRCGTNSVKTLAYGATSNTATTFEKYSPGGTLTVTDLVSSIYNTAILLSDGTIRTCGVGYGVGNGSTSGQLAFYNPGLSNVLLLGSFASFYTTYVIGNTSMLTCGDNTSGRLGIGNTSSPSTFTACAGSVTSQTLNSIKFMCSVSNACYYVYNNKVYAAGGGAMVLDSANRYSFAQMTTPY